MPYSFIKWIDVNQQPPPRNTTILFSTEDPDMPILQGEYNPDEQMFIGYLWHQKRKDVQYWALCPHSVTNHHQISTEYDNRNLEIHQG